MLDLMKINLQIFADDEYYETDEQEQDVETNEQETEEETEQEQEQKEEPNDRVPLNKYLDEKKRRKELERRLRDFEEKTMESESKSKLEAIRQKVLKKGYDDDLAELLEEITKDIYSDMPKVDKAERQILEDIEEYAEENPEVLKHKKEIIEKVKKYRKADPDFSVEDALSLIKPAKVRINELKTDIEQKNAIARRNVDNKKTISGGGGSSPKNPYPLDEADKKALEGLQKAQPEKNWTAEKYWKRKNS